MWALPGLAAGRGWAHHAWEPYDSAAPLYLEGPVLNIIWADPHPHLEIAHRPGTALPRDFARRRIPPQQEPVDVEALLRKATVPVGEDRIWQVQLPSLARLSAWGVQRPKIDDVIGVLGLRGPPVTNSPTVRAEILFIGDRAYPMRSDPA